MMKKVISSLSLNSSKFVRKIFPRTSLRSNPSSEKCQIHIVETAEIEKLNYENQNLLRTISLLKDKLDIKEATIGDLAREKEIMYTDLRKYRRNIRNIQQELEDERVINSREKEYLRGEINAMKMRIERRGIKEEIERIIQIEKENDCLKCEAEENTETIYNLCIKYLRLKTNKDAMKMRLEKLNEAQDQALADVMMTLDSNKEQLTNIITEKINKIDVSTMNKKYFMLIDKNNRLQYENATMKIKLRTLCNYLGKRGDVWTESGENLRKRGVPKSKRIKPKNSPNTHKYTKCKSDRTVSNGTELQLTKKNIYDNNRRDDKIKVLRDHESKNGDTESSSITPQSSLNSRYEIGEKNHHKNYSIKRMEIYSKSPHLGSRERSKLYSNEMLYYNRKFVDKTSDSQINDI